MKHLKQTIVLIGCVFTLNGFAQDFSYGLASFNSTYSQLQSPTLLSNGSDWNNATFKTGIGFSFPYAGQNFDSLVIEPNGFIVFDKSRNYAFATFKGVYCKQDTTGTWSSVSYTSSAGVFKIQFTNLGFDFNNPRELFSFQIWLNSTGEIEVHIGPNPTADYLAFGQTSLLGLINMNRNSSVSAFVASGLGDTPIGNILTDNDELLYLGSVPPSGKLYIFSPSH